MSGKKIIAALFFIGLVLLALFAYRYRHDLSRNLQKTALPREVPYSHPQMEPPTIAEDILLPEEVNLAVPFTPQAPHANWELPYKEFCEEASVLMAMRYVQGKPIASVEDANQAMLAIKEFEENAFGYYQDTNISDTARIISDFYQYDRIQEIRNPSARDIRAALAQGKPVIVPAAGRLLQNPFYQSPGPLYHMFVIKGYTPDGNFIVNDPGTRRGADFVYPESIVMEAMHDWRDDENITQGEKVVLIIG